MKRILRVAVLITASVLLLCGKAFGATLKDGVLTYQSESVENTGNGSVYSYGQSNGSVSFIASTKIEYSGWTCSTCKRYNSGMWSVKTLPEANQGYAIKSSNSSSSRLGDYAIIDGQKVIYNFGSSSIFSGVSSGGRSTYTYYTGVNQKPAWSDSFEDNCDYCNIGKSTITYRPSYENRTLYASYETKTGTYSSSYLSGPSPVQEIKVNSCTFDGANGIIHTLTSSIPCSITGGNYKGTPAFNSNNIVIKKGTITDTSGTSQFVIDENSESSATTSNGQTITTVKLSNPPIIIDWADFPG